MARRVGESPSGSLENLDKYMSLEDLKEELDAAGYKLEFVLEPKDFLGWHFEPGSTVYGRVNFRVFSPFNGEK